MTTITFLLCEQMLATSVTLPMEQFHAAEALQKSSKVRRASTSQLTFRLASVDGKAVTTHTGMLLQPNCALGEIDKSSITYIPALWRNPKTVIKHNQAVLPWLVKQKQEGGIIAGVGTGCCFMAEAGLLDFRPATTHWYYFDKFAANYPRVLLKRNHFITRSDNLYCTASVNSLADLTVFFIQEIFGEQIARHVERHFFHEVRKAFPQMQSEHGELQAHPDEDVARAQSWIQQNVQKNMQVRDVAASLDMSLRTFNRRFKNATNLTPIQYIQNVKMRHAGELLHSSNLAVSEIAYRSGYQDLAHFSDLFKKYFGTTPAQYRITVRAKLFSADSL
jgi:transcriptional regulator GlxA family with amidase domain